MYSYRYVDNFQGFLYICRKGENLPTIPTDFGHAKNPQDIIILWIIWARCIYLGKDRLLNV